MIAQDQAERLRKRRGSGRSGPLARGRGRRRARARRFRPPRPKVLAIVALVLGLLAAGWLWVRDSSLVAVNRVSVTGISGPDATQIRRALTTAARTMTTLDVSVSQLRTAVAPYPVVKDLHVSTQFPHGMKIAVAEQIPVAQITVGWRAIPVAGDGTLLHDLPGSGSLPSIQLRVPPGGARVTDPQAREAVSILAAAPYPMLAHISQVVSEPSHGLVAQIRNGPSVYFGDATALSAKWAAVTAVLADPGSAGADYIDVTDPRRPAAGASAGATSAASNAGAATAGASAGVTSAASNAGAAAAGASAGASPTASSPGASGGVTYGSGGTSGNGG